MEQTLFEQNGGTYTQQGDYLLPNIKLPDQPEYEIGVWGQRRRQYLKQHHKIKYYNMLTQCTLYPHLAEAEQRAQKMFDELVDEMAMQESITEQLKAENMITWVKKMNAVREQAAEIVNRNLICRKP